MSTTNSNPSRKFQAKNLIYLRISKRCVLMTKLLIDPPHLDWFETNSKAILSKLIEILKPRILNKLNDENNSTSKKSKLDIYRGSGFQFGYYFRNLTYQHSILLKSRETIHPVQSDLVSPEKQDAESDEEDIKPDLPSSSLKVHYEPFSIFGKSLMVIIEPFPLVGSSQMEEDAMPSTAGEKAKPTHPRAHAPRAEKPLFIPDDDDDEGVLEDLSLDFNQSHQSHPTLLSQLIKDPTSDRQLDHKSQPQSLRLDDFLLADPSSSK
ncbi:hypothetical protein PGTUg99_026137 [Puccinia graminis f. sp. tritici]|uniref:Uncharacterized protein n=1 Tax=Puccinia graminis f. sp. tritici TaxID=56615 RepID=A0A5B0R672_PUCGR|nr:hypothetical protein PGTUg99_026137 [Puccinia graminis f. sp. tritici]